MNSQSSTASQGGHFAIRTATGKCIRADFISKNDPKHPDWDGVFNYWCIWITANRDFTAGTHYRLFSDGTMQHWHLYEDGTERRLDHG